VLLSLTDETRDHGVAPPPPAEPSSGGLTAKLTSPVKAGARLVRDAAHESIEILFKADHRRELEADGEALFKILLTPPDNDTALKGQLHVADKVTWSDPVPLDLIKSIGKATDTTVNDVLVAAMTGALRDYLREQDSLVETVRAFIPFNLWPLDKPVPRDLGNHFGLVYLDLPVGTRTVKSRLREVKRTMDEIKSSPQGAVAYAILGVLGFAPERLERYAIDMFSARGSCVLTNVPGPREPVYLAGVPLGGVLFWAPTSGSVAMSISIFSYAGEVTVGLMVDAGVIPKPERLIRSFHREVAKLERLAVKPARQKEGAVA
jgi:WS/DGAT/MGAT family acyltransferase